MGEYSGWANYETWNVALWLQNYEGSYREMVAIARRAKGVDDFGRSLRQFVEDCANASGRYGDLKRADLRAVDWNELAESLWDDNKPDWIDDEDEEG